MDTNKDGIDVQEVGIPLMGEGGKSQEILGAVVTEKKGKSNINRLMVLGMVVGGIIVLAGLLMIYQKTKRKTVAAPEAKLELPAFGKKNSAVESDFILGKKREIEKEESVKALAKIEEEEAAKRRQAALLAQAGVGTPTATQPVQTGSGGGYQAPANNCPNGICAPSPNDRKLSGNVNVLIDTNKNGYGGSDSQFPDRAEKNNKWKPNGMPEDYPSRPTIPAFLENMMSGKGNGTQQEADTSIGSRLKPTVLAARYAGNLSNMDYLLKKGTVIPCSLKTGIDTTLPSLVICTATNDVYSANGRTQLITRGATILGEQQSSLTLGQARVFVLWTRVDNPDGTFAQIDSPAADAMGFGGIGGFVDTHFAERFGAAILISVIKDATQFALSNLANNPQATVPTNTAQAGSSMAQEVLKSTVNIPPTLIVNPATRVNVLVARDVSFETVYKVVEQ